MIERRKQDSFAENENKSFHLVGGEKENKSVTSFLLFFLLLVMYIRKEIPKYKANEIENFIAVYKRVARVHT